MTHRSVAPVHPRVRSDVGTESFVRQFAAQLRSRADLLRTFGASEASSTCSHIAEELESSFRSWWLEELTITEAGRESGYSEERLRELVREAKLPAAIGGSHGRQLVRRCDLPRRPAPRLVSADVDGLAQRLLQRSK